MKNIFISYAWDKENDEKVIKLAEMLEEYKELNVKFDKWDINKGQEIPLFMEKEIQQSDFVLVICSNRYKENTDKRIGGSGYKDRFLPVLLNENDKDHIPNFLTGKLWTSLYYQEGSEEYNIEINDLLTTIVGRSKRNIKKAKVFMISLKM